MNFYNFLFYKGVELGIKTRNYSDTPLLGGLSILAPILGFNILAISMALDIFLNCTVIKSIASINKLLLAVSFVLILSFYYGFKSRYKRIIENFDKKRQKGNIYDWHPALVIAPVLLISAGLVFILLYLASLKKPYG